MGKFTGKAEKKILVSHFLDMVRTELHQSARSLGRSKAGKRCLQAGERLFGAEVMDFQLVKSGLAV